MKSRNWRHLLAKCLSASLLAVLFDALQTRADEPATLAWYAMDEIIQESGARRITDASGNGRNLTLGDGCWLTNGIAGPGLFFDGTADAWSSFAGPAMGSRTVSMLFRREHGNGPLLEGQSTYPYIIDTFSTMRIHFATANDSVTVYVTSQPMSSGSFSRGIWHHLAWVYEQTETAEPNVYNGTLKAYCDGILISSPAPLTLTNTASAGTAYLGNHSNKTRPVHGCIDEVRIYDGALTDAQVKQEALRSMETGRSVRLLGHWDMESLTETNGVLVMRDLTGNGLDLEVGDGCRITNGVFGSAMNFGGNTNSYSFFNNCPVVSSWSFAGWIRQDPASATPLIAGNFYPRILNGYGVNPMWHMGSTGDKLTFNGYGHPVSQQQTLRVGGDIWAHYAVVNRMGYNADSNDFTSVPDFYVNGQKITTGIEQVTGKLIWDPNNKINFGNNAKNGTRAFMGDFDDFRFYDGPLSAQEVRDICQGAPEVSAGADFTVASEQATLRGAASESNANPISPGLSAQTFWTLISAPAGGEGARFETPESESTRVTLPVTGEYVFRLTASNSAYSASDEVTVTRVAAPGSNQPPTVSLAATASVTLPAPLDLSATVADPDAAPGTLRVTWSKVSGPNGVYFDDASTHATRATFLTAGEHVLRCTADDGLDSASADIAVTVSGSGDPFNVTNGLVRYYPVNSAPVNKEAVGGSTAMIVPKYVEGVFGYGLRSPGANDYSDTKLRLPEDGPVNSAPTNITHLAFSFWMFHDTADTNVSADAALVHVGYTLGVYYRCQNVSPGFLFFQQGAGGAAMWYNFPRPANPPQDRWMHVYACFDRAAGDELDLYIDGDRQTKDSSGGKNAARVRTEPLQIGGMTVTTGGPQGPLTNSVSGGFYSRVFPGVMDEVRVYNRKLSDAEIACLAARPAWLNRAPLPETVARTLSGHVGQTLPLQAAAYDDGLPDGSTLTCRWRFVDGDESGLAIADTAEPSTAVTLLKAGTYSVQLEASDGDRAAYSEVVAITVNPGGTVILLQ